jgi:hypothetical protein
MGGLRQASPRPAVAVRGRFRSRRPAQGYPGGIAESGFARSAIPKMGGLRPGQPPSRCRGPGPFSFPASRPRLPGGDCRIGLRPFGDPQDGRASPRPAPVPLSRSGAVFVPGVPPKASPWRFRLERKQPALARGLSWAAVRGGFEPPIPVKVCRFSKPVVSATHPPHRGADPPVSGRAVKGKPKAECRQCRGAGFAGRRPAFGRRPIP